MMSRLLKREFMAVVFLAASLITPVYAQQNSATNTPSPLAGTIEHRHSDAEAFIRTELFFGTDKPDGGEISKDDFRKFLKEEVTTRFPAGLTILRGAGQFRDLEREKIVREKSMVLILLYPLNAWEESNEKIEQIRKRYKKRFKQQSVLRVDESRPVLVSF